MSTAIDLSQLPAPTVVETLDYESVLAALQADFTARYPAFTAALESEPVLKLLEVAAWRELIVRGRVNDAARACMLAYALGSDLDHLAALYGVQRLLLDAGDPTAVPPVPPTYESDARLRARNAAGVRRRRRTRENRRCYSVATREGMRACFRRS